MLGLRYFACIAAAICAYLVVLPAALPLEHLQWMDVSLRADQLAILGLTILVLAGAVSLLWAFRTLLFPRRRFQED